MQRRGDLDMVTVKDWEDSVEGLTPEEEGLLMQCLLRIEITGRPIPLSDSDAAQILGLSAPERMAAKSNRARRAETGAQEYLRIKTSLLKLGKLKRTPDGIVLGDGVEKLIMRGSV